MTKIDVSIKATQVMVTYSSNYDGTVYVELDDVLVDDLLDYVGDDDIKEYAIDHLGLVEADND